MSSAANRFIDFPQSVLTITEMAPTSNSLLKAPNSVFTFKTLC